MPRLLALALNILLAVPLSARAAEAPEAGDFKPVIAVLYFDNNTGKPALDVLRKGFADMMVTDLSAVRQLQVVEREKLQKLLDELRLQRSGYFDSKTVQRIGQGIGAQFAVAGSLQAVDPSLRIDVRLVEIATGKVLLAEKVIGKKNQLFDLQQQLVGRFVKALLPRIDQLPKPRSRAPDVDTLLSYSKGLDLADQGKLQEASVQLAAVVSQAPTFLLARERHEEFLARLKGAEQRRAETLTRAVRRAGHPVRRVHGTEAVPALAAHLLGPVGRAGPRLRHVLRAHAPLPRPPRQPERHRRVPEELRPSLPRAGTHGALSREPLNACASSSPGRGTRCRRRAP